MISYYHPLEDKIGNIHSYLLQQHHFTCQCTRCIPYLQHAQEEDGKDDVFGHGDGEVYSGMYDAITQAQDALTTIQQQEQDIHTLYIHDQEEDIPIHKVYAHIQALYAYIHCPSPSPLDTLVQGEGEGRYIMVYMAHTLVNLCAKYHELYFQHDEHTHTLQAHPHPHTHILTVHTVWIVSTLYLIRSKTRYAGADHPDYSMHYQDILNSLEVMAGVMRDQQLAFLDYLHTLHQAVAQLGLTIPLSASLPRTYKPPYALSSLLSICQKTYPLLHSICAHSVVEKARLEKMYHLVKRYPDIAFVKKEPGALYLGKA
ncbi:hypothetical protein EON65_09295 [archaeon]|nr:MAG: hypothetical protein EON65_09295 [archaeon]